MSLKCGRAALRRSSIQQGLISNSYGSINCHTELPYVDYQWQWPARKDRFQTHHRPPAPHRDASNKQGGREAWRCWLNAKHNNVEDVGRELSPIQHHRSLGHSLTLTWMQKCSQSDVTMQRDETQEPMYYWEPGFRQLHLAPLYPFPLATSVVDKAARNCHAWCYRIFNIALLGRLRLPTPMTLEQAIRHHSICSKSGTPCSQAVQTALPWIV